MRRDAPGPAAPRRRRPPVKPKHKVIAALQQNTSMTARDGLSMIGDVELDPALTARIGDVLGEATMPLRSLQTQLGSTILGMMRLGEAMNEIVRLSPMVIALRTDAALSALADPTAAPSGEPVRMVAEKIDALAQGAVAATLEAGLAVTRTFTERRLPFDAGFGIAAAAMEPIRGRLRDNVRRLGSGNLGALPRAAE